MFKANKLIILLILLLPIFSIAKPDLQEKPLLLARFPQENPKYDMYQIVSGEEHVFTTNWAFVVDGSNSTSHVVGKLLAGFNVAISLPLDQLKFCAFVFNQRYQHKFRNWVPADVSGVEFARTDRWIRRNIGVNSFGELAIRDALIQPVKELTIIIISDGGFSENFSNILATIKLWQQWRVNEGLGEAVIATIGIENHLSRESKPPYPKDTDEVCQNRMRQIGVSGRGGYYLVKRTDF